MGNWNPRKGNQVSEDYCIMGKAYRSGLLFTSESQFLKIYQHAIIYISSGNNRVVS